MIPVKSYAAQTEGAAGPGSCLHESEPCKKLFHEVTVSHEPRPTEMLQEE
jgi:hypothetical protein